MRNYLGELDYYALGRYSTKRRITKKNKTILTGKYESRKNTASLRSKYLETNSNVN